MEHQPFENWIIDEMELSAEKQRELQGHLQTCDACRTLAANWNAARGRLQSAEEVAPRPGFSRRFQFSLVERRARQQQLQVRRAMLGFGAAAAALFLVLCGYLVWNADPVNILVTLLENTMRLLGRAQFARDMLSTWFSVIPLSIPLAIWVVLSTGFAVVVIGWLFTLWRIASQGVNNK